MIAGNCVLVDGVCSRWGWGLLIFDTRMSLTPVYPGRRQERSRPLDSSTRRLPSVHSRGVRFQPRVTTGLLRCHRDHWADIVHPSSPVTKAPSRLTLTTLVWPNDVLTSTKRMSRTSGALNTARICVIEHGLIFREPEEKQANTDEDDAGKECDNAFP